MSDSNLPAPVESPPWVDEPFGFELDTTVDPGSDERWSITSESLAEWAMSKRAAATAAAADVQAQYDLWRDRLDEWRKARLADPVSTCEFFDWHLEHWAVEQRAASGDKVKTVKLVSGDVTTSRATAPKVSIDDPVAFCEWALEAFVPAADDEAAVPGDVSTWSTFAAAGAVKTSYSPVVARVRELVHPVEDREALLTDAGPAVDDDGNPVESVVWRVVTSDGELVPGCSVVLPETTATVKPHPLTLNQPPAPKEIS